MNTITENIVYDKIVAFDIWVRPGAIVKYVLDDVTEGYVVKDIIFANENPIRIIAMDDSSERLYG
jgi:hypothetical protein